jgi:hypothetical protein
LSDPVAFFIADKIVGMTVGVLHYGLGVYCKHNDLRRLAEREDWNAALNSSSICSFAIPSIEAGCRSLGRDPS